ncbi:hypothetical protein UCD39_22425 [Nitrospirillum sp. BR 11752]|uniref:hypothetical protein n=1 Tax=Nitrospirillum sp. BR 11752 TaxID=3104293 RepID=UPI002EBBF421|nr:hypothetical protein [Nitrospirillum sp. BR 11752]
MAIIHNFSAKRIYIFKGRQLMRQGLCAAVVVGLALTVAGASAAVDSKSDETWIQCDGRPRPPDAGVIKAAHVLFFLPRMIWKNDSPAQRGAADQAHVAHGIEGVAACEAAMSDVRSRDWPLRRASQWVALTLHALTAGLQDPARLPAFADVVARYQAERAQAKWPDTVLWEADGWIDAMTAVAAMASGEKDGGSRLATLVARRPADFDLLRFVATAALLPDCDQPTRLALWMRLAAFDRSQRPIVNALQTAPSLPFLPSGEELVAELWRQLVPNLNLVEGAAEVDKYGQSGFGGRGFDSQSIDQGTGARVTYEGSVTSPEMVQEMALYRAAEMAEAAGAPRLRIKAFLPWKTIMTSHTFMNGAMIGGSSHIVSYKVAYDVTFVRDDADADSTIEVASLVTSLRQDFIPMLNRQR